MTNMTKSIKAKYLNTHQLAFIAVLSIALISLQGCKQEKSMVQKESPKEQPKELTKLVNKKNTDPEETLANLMAEIKTENCQQESDCAIVGVGAKPCGGPDSYAVYSIKSSDVKKVTQLAGIYQQQMEKYYQDNAIMGICMVTPKPDIACNNNQCVLSKSNSNLL